ncbi:glycosyltransferase family 39 protein [Candidatus Saccharibacteria bacterium]|nr:glycosyltransferase family 39 protein [Candidatus Saccharibacteria bacterium]
MLKVARGWIRRWPAGHVIFFLSALGLLGLKLSSITPGISGAESASRQSSTNLNSLLDNPLNAPYRLIEHYLIKLWPDNVFSLRLTSVILAVLIAWCFYKLAVNWFGRLIGLFGSLIFLSTPLLIIAAHQASSEIMFFSPIIVMWLFAWLAKAERTQVLAWLSLLVACGLLVYTPGMLWWVLGAAIISRKRLMAAVDPTRMWASAAGLALAAGLAAPLVISTVKHSHIIKPLLLIPSSWPVPLTIFKQLGWMGLAIFVKTPSHALLILDRLALISALVIALAIFGIYAMASVAKSKAVTLALGIGFAVIAAGINNNLYLLALGLPAILIFASAGLRYLYIEWRSIFPRNPVPKSFALLLIATVTLSQLYFGIRYGLIAWPRNSATRSAYVLK